MQNLFTVCELWLCLHPASCIFKNLPLQQLYIGGGRCFSYPVCCLIIRTVAKSHCWKSRLVVSPPDMFIWRWLLCTVFLAMRSQGRCVRPQPQVTQAPKSVPVAQSPKYDLFCSEGRHYLNMWFLFCNSIMPSNTFCSSHCGNWLFPSPK